MFIIEAPSATAFNACIIGSGPTEAEAWANAYGPKPWTPYVRKCAAAAWVREVTADEFDELMSQ